MTLADVLASIRARVEAGTLPRFKRFINLNNGENAYWPEMHVYDITDRDPYAQRYDHPKD